MTDHTATIIGHVFLFLTTLAGFVYSWLREGRRHRWQQEQFQQLGTKIENGHSNGPTESLT